MQEAFLKSALYKEGDANFSGGDEAKVANFIRCREIRVRILFSHARNPKVTLILSSDFLFHFHCDTK